MKQNDTDRNYRPDIDGLRALSILGVIFYHLFPSALPGGFAGVDIFFVVSGFLITQILLKQHHAGMLRKGSDLIAFYQGRVIRLMPALFVMLLGSFLLAFLLYRPADLATFSFSGLSAILYYSNFYFWKTINYFEPDIKDSPLIHTWSLSVEEQFYFSAPIMVLFILKYWKSAFGTILLLGVALSFTLNEVGPLKSTVAQFYLLPTRAWELGIGMICAYFSQQLTQIDGRLTRHFRQIAVLSICAFFALYEETGFYPDEVTLIPVLSAAMIVSFQGADSVGRILSHRWLVGAGLMSYSLYLWHQPILALGQRVEALPHYPALAEKLLLTAITIFVSYFSWRFVEIPFRYGMERRSALLWTSVMAASTLILFLTAAVTDGYLARYSKEDRRLASLNFKQEGLFVEQQFLSLLDAGFSAGSSSRKVLLTGDSFAQDLLNVVKRSKLADVADVATIYVSARCGNLYLEWTQIAEHILPVDRKFCNSNNSLINNARFAKLAEEADEIWLASSWATWQVDLLQESIEGLKAMAPQARIVVFGAKGAGPVDLNSLLKTPPVARTNVVSIPPPEIAVVNSSLKSIARKMNADFYDTQALLCSDVVTSCQIFLPGIGLITYDGHHLTKEGASYLGSKFMMDRFVVPQKGSIGFGKHNAQ